MTRIILLNYATKAKKINITYCIKIATVNAEKSWIFPKKVGHFPKKSWTSPQKYVRHYLKSFL